jgi:superoxide dismutase, Fe-Mn family
MGAPHLLAPAEAVLEPDRDGSHAGGRRRRAVLVLDMYEHAYQMDFGANATAYIDTFFRNINWEAVLKRIEAVRNDRPLPNEDPSSTKDVPSLSVAELAAQIANGCGVQIVDARQRDHMSRHVDLMAGATWRDPDRVGEWIAELTPDKPVAVYCSPKQ